MHDSSVVGCAIHLRTNASLRLHCVCRGGPFTAVLDIASNSTAGNWAAARDLDVTSIAQGQSSSYPRETGRLRPLMCAHFDTVSEHGIFRQYAVPSFNSKIIPFGLVEPIMFQRYCLQARIVAPKRRGEVRPMDSSNIAIGSM